MTDIHQQAILMYEEEKFSEMQIADKLSISPKEVRKILDKNNVVRRSRNEAIRWHYLTTRNEEERLPKHFLTQEEELLKVAGIMLYWGEGTKERGTVALSNSDPKMISVFVRFLRIICNINNSRLHATIHYYEDQDIIRLTKFWASIIQIPEQQFYKGFMHHRKSTGSYRKPSLYGTILLQYSDKKLLSILKEWMDEYQKVGLTISSQS